MSVGSLTTTFTPPTSCLDAFSTTALATTLITASRSTLTDSFLFAGPWTTQGCMPDNFKFSSTNYYSPGICPVGYTTACSTVIAETVTAATCCPTSYSCNTNATDAWQSTWGCQSAFASAVFPSLLVITGSPASIVKTSTSFGNQGAVNAFSVQIRYQSTDFQSSQSPQTSTLSPSTATPTVSSSTTTPTVSSSTTASTSSSSDASGGGGGGISPAAAAGIGVGTTAAVFLLVGAFAFVYYLGRKRRFIGNRPSYGPLKQDNAPDSTIILKAELPVPETTVPGTTVPETTVPEMLG